jgi:Fic family protein
MDFKLETEFSKTDILKQVDALKRQIDDARPLPKDVEERVMQKLRLEWNYNSNAIEGNKLNYGETTALLMHGITAKGKPLKDHLDIQGHNDAINFLQAIIKEDRPFTEIDIRQLHETILVESYTVKAQTDDGKSTTKQIKLGVYKTSPNHVKTITGETHYYATPEETPAKMQELMIWYTQISKDKDVHPVVIAALFHHKFVEIHPFDDGNGRLARMLMNLILMKNGYPPTIIKMEDRQNYYSLLSRADVGNSWPFIEYIIRRLMDSLRIYIRGINGEDIDEDEDIDKEIALFKLDIKNTVDLVFKKSEETTSKIINEEIIPLIQKILNKAKSFDELFFTVEKFSTYQYRSEILNHSKVEIIYDNNVGDVLINRNYNNVVFHCDFREFKNSKRTFDIELNFSVEFEEYKYSVYDFTNELVTNKYYHEHISKEEQQKVIKTFVAAIKDKIHQALKSPES